MGSERKPNSDSVNLQLTFLMGQVPNSVHFCPISYHKELLLQFARELKGELNLCLIAKQSDLGNGADLILFAVNLQWTFLLQG